MLNKLNTLIRTQNMIRPGQQIVCAVSGGADSVALLFGLYLLREKLDFSLSAAHFNHHLRGDESDRDEAFVRDFCDRFDIPLYVGGAQVEPGPKGLEAAARDARYAFLRTLPGTIATAHTADDNAETILLHLIRGTGLKGLCGITPVGEGLIRPMLTVTRAEVEAFLEEYHLPHIHDSSNDTDAFLRNRLRHHVMPLLQAENPRLAENLTAMSMGLQEEERLLERLTDDAYTLEISVLRQMEAAIRCRVLERFLQGNGIKEPQRSHIALAENLVFSEKPSAQAAFPGGVLLERCYETLRVRPPKAEAWSVPVRPGLTQVPGWRVTCRAATEILNNATTFTLSVQGDVCLRCRQTGDEMRLSGGTKTLKKLFIDRKIPASQRWQVPVLADESGVLGVPGVGANVNKIANSLPAVQFIFEKDEAIGGF
jgi:tRNA(Ile)-lysidine synthase